MKTQKKNRTNNPSPLLRSGRRLPWDEPGEGESPTDSPPGEAEGFDVRKRPSRTVDDLLRLEHKGKQRLEQREHHRPNPRSGSVPSLVTEQKFDGLIRRSLLVVTCRPSSRQVQPLRFAGRWATKKVPGQNDRRARCQAHHKYPKVKEPLWRAQQPHTR